VQVVIPVLAGDTAWLNLQGKISGQDDSEYVDIATRLGAPDPEMPPDEGYTPPPYEVDDLISGVTYTFRFVAVGPGGTTEGQSADFTIPVPAATWSAGGAIQSGGIEWPSAGMTIGAGNEGHLNAYLATDWDYHEMTVNGQTESRWFSDPCTYSWDAVDGNGDPVGYFKDGRSTGQSVVWIAPTTPGIYTIVLEVDDQGGANQGTGEAGSRDDAAVGYDDDPQKFTVTITVQ
jgi:hypothetical protein